MDNLEQALSHLDRIEEMNPEVAYATAEIKDFIESIDLDSSQWSVLIERYRDSRAQAIVAALAWSLSDDADRAVPKVDLGGVLRLSETNKLANSSVVSGILEALAKHIRPGTDLHHNMARELRDFLVRCFSYKGQGEFIVKTSMLDILEKLQKAHHFEEVFDAQSRSDLNLWTEAFLRKEKVGPFAEQVGEILKFLQA